MNVKQMRNSKFLTKEDAGEGILLTIKGVSKQNVALPNETPEEKWVLLFEENKPLVLNSTNTKRAAKACGSDETDDWVGKQVVAFNDEDIEYAGEIVGGIRLRAPKGAAARSAKPSPARVAERDSLDSQEIRAHASAQAFEDDSDSVPF